MVAMRFLIMLPVVLSIGDAAGPGGSTYPRTSLMQSGSKNKKVSLMAEGESMLTAGSVSHALAGFQRFTDDLVDQYKKTGMPMDDDTKKAIQTVIGYINGMYQRLLDWHEIDVKRTVSCSTDKYDRCVDDFLVSEEQKVKLLGEKVDALRVKVRNCAQQADNDSTAKDADCEDYDQYRTGQGIYTPEWPELPGCVEPQGHLERDFINTSVEGRRTTMESCLSQMKAWFQPLYTRYLKCPMPRGGGVGEQAPCRSDQNNFEDKHCLWSEQKNVSCEGYKTCVHEVDEDCDEHFCSEIETNVNARKAENETGERIICLLDVLVNSSNASKPGDLGACKDKEYNTSEFNLTCPAVGENPKPIPSVFQECDPSKFEPRSCTPAFLMTEYRSPKAPFFMDEQISLCDCRVCGMLEPVVQPPAEEKDDFGVFIPGTCPKTVEV